MLIRGCGIPTNSTKIEPARNLMISQYLHSTHFLLVKCVESYSSFLNTVTHTRYEEFDVIATSQAKIKYKPTLRMKYEF